MLKSCSVLKKTIYKRFLRLVFVQLNETDLQSINSIRQSACNLSLRCNRLRKTELSQNLE